MTIRGVVFVLLVIYGLIGLGFGWDYLRSSLDQRWRRRSFLAIIGLSLLVCLAPFIGIALGPLFWVLGQLRDKADDAEEEAVWRRSFFACLYMGVIVVVMLATSIAFGRPIVANDLYVAAITLGVVFLAGLATSKLPERTMQKFLAFCFLAAAFYAAELAVVRWTGWMDILTYVAPAILLAFYGGGLLYYGFSKKQEKEGVT